MHFWPQPHALKSSRCQTPTTTLAVGLMSYLKPPGASNLERFQPEKLWVSSQTLPVQSSAQARLLLIDLLVYHSGMSVNTVVGFIPRVHEALKAQCY